MVLNLHSWANNYLPQSPLLGSIRLAIKSAGSVLVAVPLLEASGIALVVRTATRRSPRSYMWTMPPATTHYWAILPKAWFYITAGIYSCLVLDDHWNLPEFQTVKRQALRKRFYVSQSIRRRPQWASSEILRHKISNNIPILQIKFPTPPKFPRVRNTVLRA